MFFIYFFDLPHEITLMGVTIPTFVLVVVCVLTLSISIICMGGTLALVITDTIQGIIMIFGIILTVVAEVVEKEAKGE